MWEKFKNLGWVKQIGLILSMVFLALLAGKAARRDERASRAERTAENLLHDKTKEHVEKAAILQEKAAKDKEVGVKAREQMNTQLEKIGEKNHTMDELAHHFNSKRVRKQSGDDTP